MYLHVQSIFLLGKNQILPVALIDHHNVNAVEYLANSIFPTTFISYRNLKIPRTENNGIPLRFSSHSSAPSLSSIKMYLIKTMFCPFKV